MRNNVMNNLELALQIDSVSRLYKRGNETVTALHEVSFECHASEFIGLTGPSGSGKTTLLNIIGLADKPSVGAVYLQGTKVNFSNEAELISLRRHSIGYVFQHFNLLSSLSALDNVAISLVLSGLSLKAAREGALERLQRLGLSERASHEPQQLSGGEMQRVAIARACVHQPKIIIADEPTGNLDSHAGQSVLELLKGLCREGTAILMATHSERALAVCDRVIVLEDGAIKNSNQARTI